MSTLNFCCFCLLDFAPASTEAPISHNLLRPYLTVSLHALLARLVILFTSNAEVAFFFCSQPRSTEVETRSSLCYPSKILGAFNESSLAPLSFHVRETDSFPQSRTCSIDPGCGSSLPIPKNLQYRFKKAEISSHKHQTTKAEHGCADPARPLTGIDGASAAIILRIQLEDINCLSEEAGGSEPAGETSDSSIALQILNTDLERNTSIPLDRREA